MLKKLSVRSKRRTSFQSKRIEKLYDTFSEEYENIWRDERPRLPFNKYIEFPAMLEQAGRIKGMKLLDAGCGSGEHLLKYMHSGALCSGVDISGRMVEAAKRRTGPGILKCDINEGLPFGDSSFDIVTMSLVIDHFRDAERVLGEAGRVLKGGGRILISYSAGWLIGMARAPASSSFTSLISGVLYFFIIISNSEVIKITVKYQFYHQL